MDSGAAESVWPEGLMPEIQTMPSVGSQTGVTYIAASGNKMPNLGEEGPLQDEGRPELQHHVPSDQGEEAPRSPRSQRKGTGYASDPVKRTLKTWQLARGPTLSSTTAHSLDVEYFNEPGFTRLERR